MNSTANRWKLGLFVVTGLAATFGALVWLGAKRFGRHTYPAVSYFDESVQGLEIGSPVKYNGVKIGAVRQITVAPDHRMVEVIQDMDVDVIERLGLSNDDPELRCFEGRPFVPPELRAQLASAGITGAVFIQSHFVDPEKVPPPVLDFDPPWNYVPAQRSTLGSLTDGLSVAVAEWPEITSRVKRLLEDVDEAVVGLDARGLSSRTQKLLAMVDDTLADVRQAGIVTRVADAIDVARASLQSLKAAAERIGNENGPLHTLLESADGVVKNLDKAIEDAQVRTTAQSLRGAATSIGDVANDLHGSSEELRSGLIAFREALVSLKRLADVLERDPSALVRGKAATESSGGRN